MGMKVVRLLFRGYVLGFIINLYLKEYYLNSYILHAYITFLALTIACHSDSINLHHGNVPKL